MPGFKVHKGADEVETISSKNGYQDLLEGLILLNQSETKKKRK